MFRNYFKIAWRHLLKNRAFSIINILGLSIGIAGALLIMLHIKEELSYDKGFSRSNRIFRITQQGLGEDTRHWAATSPPMASSLEQKFPEIENAVRFYRPYPNQVFSYTPSKGEAKRFEEKGGFFADEDVVKIFDLSFVHGNSKTALSETNAIVLTETLAAKYFGQENPIGKTIVDNQRKLSLKVTGVVRSFPFPTHLKFDYLLAMNVINHYQDKSSMERRTWNAFYTYVLLNKNYSKERTEEKLKAFTREYFAQPGESNQEMIPTRKLNLQPITDIHLHSHLEKEMNANSSMTYVYIFSVVALFILLLASVNFVNISTAQAFGRMKEAGLRKVVGGTRWQLIKQFLGESFLITLLAAVVAILLLKWSIPFYNRLTENHFLFSQLLTWTNAGMLCVLIVIVGLLSGLYPASFIANLNPITSLKGANVSQSSPNILRRGLIIFQFVISVFMIFSTITVYRQMQFFSNKNLGFDKEQLVAVTMYEDMWNSFSALANDIRKNAGISNYSIVSTLPGERFPMQMFAPVSASSKDDAPGSRVMWADENLLATMGVPLKEGRNFVSQFPDIKRKEFIVNEAAVEEMRLKDPLGKQFIMDVDTGEVVGVIKNFNFASLHSPIEPLVISYNPYMANYLLLKVRPNQVKEVLQFLETDLKRLSPSSVFSYTFVDDKLNQLYESENRMSSVFKIFAGFALFISCLGLFGLSAYSARIRVKEVGIRKLLGASVSDVTFLLSNNFMKLVLAGIVVAWPLAWWVMTRWLEGFAYHINIDVWIFAISGALAFVVGLLTVSFQSVKAARANPAKSLKTE